MILNKRMVSGDLDMLRFLFPNYKIIDEVEENPTEPCIFTGKLADIDKLKEIYDNKKLDYIVFTRGQSDINLKDRFTLANVVFEKHKRLVPKYLSEILDKLDEEVFIKNIKTYWIAGKWQDKSVDNEDTFLSFVDTVNKSSMEMYRTYFKVVQSIKPYKLESSFMTFLNRAKDGNNLDINYRYRNKLKLFENDKLLKSIEGLENSLDYNIDNIELRLLNEIVRIMEFRNKNLSKM